MKQSVFGARCVLGLYKTILRFRNTIPNELTLIKITSLIGIHKVYRRNL